MAGSSRGVELPSHKDFDDLVSIREQVDQVPVSPGCYLWKDGSGKVIYVGKAKNLRSHIEATRTRRR